MPEPRASEYTTPPGAERKDPAESLRILREHAREAGNALLKMRESDDLGDPADLLLISAEMNGREFVLGILLEEAIERIEKLEAKVLLLLQVADCMVDDLRDLKQRRTDDNTQPEEEEVDA